MVVCGMFAMGESVGLRSGELRSPELRSPPSAANIASAPFWTRTKNLLIKSQSGDCRKALHHNELEGLGASPGVTGECACGGNRRDGTSPDVNPCVSRIAAAWPSLPPHVKETILMLVDASDSSTLNTDSTP